MRAEGEDFLSCLLLATESLGRWHLETCWWAISIFTNRQNRSAISEARRTLEMVMKVACRLSGEGKAGDPERDHARHLQCCCQALLLPERPGNGMFCT